MSNKQVIIDKFERLLRKIDEWMDSGKIRKSEVFDLYRNLAGLKMMVREEFDSVKLAKDMLDWLEDNEIIDLGDSE